MDLQWCAILLIISYFVCITANENKKPKTVLVALFARNKELTLPHFLTLFENLNYPKDRLSLFIRSDHNYDKTIEILKKWLSVNNKIYHSIDYVLDKDSPRLYEDETSPTNWTDARFDNLINMKNEAFDKARRIWADFIWYIDMDVFLLNPNVLTDLIKKEKSIVSPMLNSLGTYSNFWCGMTSEYWYRRTDEYIPILERKNIGCFSVPMIHSCVLIDLNIVLTDKLTFNPNEIEDYDGPGDDIIAFAISASKNNLEMYICNDVGHGYIPSPLVETDSMSKDLQLLSDLRLEIITYFEPLQVSPLLKEYERPHPKKHKLGFDNMYLINLARRTDRRKIMYNTFDELGLDVEYFEAVDGQKLNDSHLDRIGVEQLQHYKDPWSKRDMTFGEIGCFLSHYYIWEDIIEKNYEKVVVFEDDIRYQPYFRDKVKYIMNQIEESDLPWDLIYLGRKHLKDFDEPWVEGSDILVHAGYSYWTLCYILSLQGAKKLVQGEPLGKMVPVDEYLPIMFNKHPSTDWMNEFSNRNLIAYSAEPLLVHPTHYTGEDGYFSDTEDSPVITELPVDSLFPIPPPSGINNINLGSSVKDEF